MRRILCCMLFAALTFSSTTTFAGTNEDLLELLKQIKEDKVTESKANKARETEFRAKKNEQQSLLSKAAKELKSEKLRSETLKKEYDVNEKKLTELKDTLEQRKGTLGEMFGLVRQTAGDTKGIFEASLISAQYPDRTALFSKLAESTALPSIEELEQLWIEMHQAMTESGRIVKFPATVVYGEGTEESKEVLRVGSFNAVADGKYLNYVSQTGKFEQLSRQPEGRVLATAQSIGSATSGYTPFYIDPSRGVILSLLVQSPSVEERIAQGGAVGYVIIGLGCLGLMLALYGYLRLSRIDSRVKKQLKSEQVITGNPMGEVMKVYQDNKDADVETLELKLDEVIVKNVPKLERGVGFIKLFASVAPLLGLLGTVIGMIATFQAITLFGTGDPKLMAGGISEALVTTMLGLIVAVPLVFAHSIVNGKSRRLIQMLEEQSAGFIAMHKEAEIAK